MVTLSYIILVVYVIYWIILDYFFHRAEPIVNSTTPSIRPFCSIIICAHNEENNIAKCLHSILYQSDIAYAEIILVDDGSTDRTKHIAQNILQQQTQVPYTILSNEQCIGKKRSIEKAIQHSHPHAEWIILRDADTYTTSNQWLTALIQKMHPHTHLIIAPVVSTLSSKSLQEYFQYFEMLALMHLTYSSQKMHTPILCNAANMAFKKQTFCTLRPYQDNLHIFTGDDIFLLNQFWTHHYSIQSCFMPESTVYTPAHKHLSSILNQKQRWISKTFINKRLFNNFSAILIAIIHIVLLLTMIGAPFHSAIILGIKILIDWKIIYSIQKKLHTHFFHPFYFIIAELIYIPYVCALILNYICSTQNYDRRNDRYSTPHR